MDENDLKNLKKRYLIWFYKTTKEALDKIERKFTQAQIDKFILDELVEIDKSGKASRQIDEFKKYVEKKAEDGNDLKFDGKDFKSEYYFLDFKLKAIEKVIIKEFGKEVLDEIKLLYECEMTERILSSREH